MWATQHANQAWVTLRAPRVMFFDLVRSDLRYSKAYHQCLGLCQSSASSMRIESFRKMPQGRWNHVENGFRSRMSFQFEELISPAQREIKRHLNPACRCALSSFHQGWSDLKLAEPSLEMRGPPEFAWALKTRAYFCSMSSLDTKCP
jgi:hypothetical protein